MLAHFTARVKRQRSVQLRGHEGAQLLLAASIAMMTKLQRGGTSSVKRVSRLLKRIPAILDSPDYSHYSAGKAKNYLAYFEEHRSDEDKLVAPVLLSAFIEQALEFTLGETITTQEAGESGKPDFIPIDRRTHPFVLDAKGLDTTDLAVHYAEKSKYLKGHNAEYLVLTNMRDLAVFAEASPEPLEEYSFSFYTLYQDIQMKLAEVLERENTRRFIQFVEKFRYRKLSLQEKLDRVREAVFQEREGLDVERLSERLNFVVKVLLDDCKRKAAFLIDIPSYDPERARSIGRELELIASEIDPSHNIQEATEDTIAATLKATSGLYERVADAFFHRVAYFSMTRLLLVRMWEDIGFIDQSLYDGGLDKLYVAFNQELASVLRHAFSLAAKRYEWLFGVPNNYSWYEPSEEALINALYELSNFNLGKLNRDVLGTIYEEYIDKTDRKRKGQYYTPREIVSFICDRAGYTNHDSFFDVKAGKRLPKAIFDPATGSGGFLVEAARRMREESGIDLDDFNDLLDIRTAIFTGLFGSEISVFPYYITEVNLLIQLTPVVKRMIDMRRRLKGEHLPLSIVPVDSLALYNADENPYLPADSSDEYTPARLHDVLPLDPRKKRIYHKIKSELAGEFAYCFANPPYIGEKGHKELFRSTTNRWLYWQQYYQGKMDYFYWFVILGLSKLRGGGQLGFITTAYWPTADGAATLRKYILKTARIKELVFFGDVKIFEHAKGQHNMVFVLEKCSGQTRVKERSGTRIKIGRVVARHDDLEGGTIREKLHHITSHLCQHLDEDEYEDDEIKVYWSGVTQGELPEDGGPWHFEHTTTENSLLKKIWSEPLRLDK